MSAQNRREIISRVAEFLRSEGVESGRFELVIRHGDWQCRLSCCGEWPPVSGTGEESAPARPCRGYSPLEAKILAACDVAEYRSAESIAVKVGVRFSDSFKAIMTNLADLGALEPLSGKGYRRAEGLDLG